MIRRGDIRMGGDRFVEFVMILEDRIVFLRMRMVITIVLILALAPTAALAGSGPQPIKRDTVGVVRDLSPGIPGWVWYVRSSNTGSCTTFTVVSFLWGIAGSDVPLVMDQDGDGQDEAVVFRNQGAFGSFFVRGGSPVRNDFGAGTDTPIVGNFDPATAGDELGVFRSSNQNFFLDLPGGVVQFKFGIPGDIPLVGNWDNSMDGSDEVGLYRPSNGLFFLRGDNLPVSPTVTQLHLGDNGDTGIAGDWDGDGRATIGVARDFMGLGGVVHYLNNAQQGDMVSETVPWGITGDMHISGDFDGNMVDDNGCP